MQASQTMCSKDRYRCPQTLNSTLAVGLHRLAFAVSNLAGARNLSALLLSLLAPSLPHIPVASNISKDCESRDVESRSTAVPNNKMRHRTWCRVSWSGKKVEGGDLRAFHPFDEKVVMDHTDDRDPRSRPVQNVSVRWLDFPTAGIARIAKVARIISRSSSCLTAICGVLRSHLRALDLSTRGTIANCPGPGALRNKQEMVLRRWISEP